MYGEEQKYIKCPQDLILALVALIVLSPVLLVIAILVRIKIGSTVIFKQERQGITGYAQVNRLNTISWEEKFDLDVQYADNITFINE